MKKPTWGRLLAVLMAFALVAAACGGGSDGDDAGGSTGGDDSGSTATTEKAATSETTAIEAGSTSEGDVDTEIAETDATRQQGGEIAIGLEAEAVGLRPWEDTCSSPCYNMAIAIYDKLVEKTADGKFEGWLFESIEANEDFTTWTGQLRSGVTFHNGAELNAQTIADMFPIQQEGSQGSSAIGSSNLAGVEATGDLEVTYTLSQANSAFPSFLSRAPIGMVFDPAQALADPDGYANAPVGTGPFKIVSRDLDNETVVERNPDYWMTDADGTQLPYLDKISFRPIPDEGTRLDALLSGTTQVAHTLRQGTIRDGRDARDGGDAIKLFEFQGNNVGGGMFNVLTPPFDDVRVRRGLTHMNPQDKVIEALGGTGISLPGSQWFSPDSPWYSEKAAAEYPKFDFEGGKALLQEYIDDPNRSDGEAPGTLIKPELSCPPDPTLIAAMQVIEQTWSASGLVEPNLTNYDQQTHINYALGAENGFIGEHTTHCWRFSDDDDPSIGLNQGLAPPTAEIAEAAGLPGVVSPLNFANYFDGEIFTNLVAATRTDNFDERYALYEAVMIKLNQEVPIWFSGHTATALIVEENIDGLASWVLPNGSLGAGLPAAEGRWGQAFITG